VIQQAIQHIQSRTALRPEIAVVLGSGLGAFADELIHRTEIPYSEIPGWPPSTAVGHAGKLLVGKLDGREVAVMAGRAHLYEGHTQAQVTHGIRVLHALGVQSVIFTNAAGGINLSLQRGGLVLISDHINLQGANPLVGPNDDRLGPRFPDMSAPYDPGLRALARATAVALGITLREGVYVAVTGPNLETRAEYRMLRALGADVVGMSTVPEVITAVHMGMPVLGVSIITDQCLPDALAPVSLDRIIAVARTAEPRLSALVRGVLERLN